jgi:hypothetical protein
MVIGREENVGARRKATGRSKYFETFWTDNWILHPMQQHSQNWSENAKLDGPQEQEAFFNTVDVRFADTIEGHLDLSDNHRYPDNKEYRRGYNRRHAYQPG